MHLFSSGVAVVVALVIIALGIMYLSNPRAVMSSFGLPPLADEPDVLWWLRLKGPRDIASGLVVLALVARGEPWMLGVVLIILAIIPVGDMSLILAAKGSTRTALGIHGLTAALMIVAAIPLIAARA